MIMLYGIPNCDSMKKARKWLAEHDVAYDFHDYKKLGIDEAVGIDFRVFTVPAGQYESALAVRLAGGDAPDIFDASRITLPEYVDQGVLFDLTPHVGAMSGAAEFVGGDEALALGRIGGNVVWRCPGLDPVPASHERQTEHYLSI